jgi:hypothetical protein
VTNCRAPSSAAVGMAAALAGATFLYAGEARAYTFIDEIPEDACMRARSFEPQDGTLAAQHARRACRLQSFEQRMTEERRQAVASEQQARDEWLAKWMQETQPARVIHPMAFELFAGSGIINYGLAFSWDVMRNLELAARLGQRQMSCADPVSGAGADCTRTTWGVGARWLLVDKDFSPFVGAAFSSTNAALKIVHVSPERGDTQFLDGKGRAHSLSASGGMQLAISYVRLSLEYLYEHVFYTGANLNDAPKTPSEELRLVWEDSLKQDRHGVRFQVGFAF